MFRYFNRYLLPVTTICCSLKTRLQPSPSNHKTKLIHIVMSATFQTHASRGLDYQRQPRQTRQLRSRAQSGTNGPNPFDQLDASTTLERYFEGIQCESALGAFAPQTPPPAAFWTQERGIPASSMPLMPQYPDWNSSQAGENGNQAHQHGGSFTQQPRASAPAPTTAPGPASGQPPNLYAQNLLGDGEWTCYVLRCISNTFTLKRKPLEG